MAGFISADLTGPGGNASEAVGSGSVRSATDAADGELSWTVH